MEQAMKKVLCYSETKHEGGKKERLISFLGREGRGDFFLIIFYILFIIWGFYELFVTRIEF